MYSVYLITNLINNKKYVGITQRNVSVRYREHLKRAFEDDREFLLYKAMRKYGADKFKLQVLEDNIPIELGEQREQYYISEYNTYYLNGNGYNMTIGGSGTVGYQFTEEDRKKLSSAMTGRKYSPERNEKIRQAMTGRKVSKEWREKISQSRMGKFTGSENPFFGKHHSDETKHKSRVTKNSRLVLGKDKNTGKEILFDGITEAAQFVLDDGRSSAKRETIITAIDKCCNKTYDRKSSYGFVWEFVERCND